MTETNYNEACFSSAFDKLFTSAISNVKLEQEKPPQAYLLGGQSGAGKTTLHVILRKRLNFNAIVVNGDECRSLHPQYRELDRTYGAASVAHTAAWAGRMTEELIKSFSRMGYNLIIEGTLRTAEVPMKTANLLRSKGYNVSLALMAVKPEISLLSCQICYEQMRIAGTVPRATDPAHHNKIVNDIVKNLTTLEQADVFDSIELYRRSEEKVFPRKDENRNASEVLKEILFGSWTDKELEHRSFLEESLKRLKNNPSNFAPQLLRNSNQAFEKSAAHS